MGEHTPSPAAEAWVGLDVGVLPHGGASGIGRWNIDFFLLVPLLSLGLRPLP